MTTKYKMVILVRKDLGMSSGKIAVQCAHASTEAGMRCEKNKLDSWKKQGMKKVALRVNGEEELLKYKKMADDASLNTALIRDAGKTQVIKGSKTCLAIGPDTEKRIDKITGKLKML